MLLRLSNYWVDWSTENGEMILFRAERLDAWLNGLIGWQFGWMFTFLCISF